MFGCPIPVLVYPFCPYWLLYLDDVSCHLNVNHIHIYIRRFLAAVPSFAPVVSYIYSLLCKTLEEGTKSGTTSGLPYLYQVVEGDLVMEEGNDT